MLKIILEENGKSYSDFKVLEEAKNIIKDYHNKGEDVISISNETMLDALRLCVLQKELNYDDICFVMMDQTVYLNKRADYIVWPKNYNGVTCDLLRSMREIRMSKNIEE